MLSTLGKVLVGAVVVGVGAVLVKTALDDRKTYTTINGTNNEPAEEKTLVERLKERASDCATRFAVFVAKHIDDIQNSAAVIELVAGVIELGYDIKRLTNKDKILKKLEVIENSMYDRGYAEGSHDKWQEAIEHLCSSADNGKPLIVTSDETPIRTFRVINEEIKK